MDMGKNIEEICNLYKDGFSTVKIGKMYHISPTKVKDILMKGGIDIHSVNGGFLLSKKPDGYWNDKTHCENAAKTCRNRREFYRKYSSAAHISKQNGWINEFDKYFSKDKLFYGFDQKIHLIYAYELPDNSVYVGRTIDINRRHNAHKKYEQTDTLCKFCRANNLEVPNPKILEMDLNAEESQVKEHYWEEWYKERGWNILNKAATGQGSSSLGSTMRKWTYETCKVAAENCNSKEDYRKKYPTAHRVATQNHWINDFFENVRIQFGSYDTIEGCLEQCKNYSKMSEVKKQYPFLYHKICEHKWNDEIATAMGWRTYRKKEQ